MKLIISGLLGIFLCGMISCVDTTGFREEIMVELQEKLDDATNPITEQLNEMMEALGACQADLQASHDIYNEIIVNCTQANDNR